MGFGTPWVSGPRGNLLINLNHTLAYCKVFIMDAHLLSQVQRASARVKIILEESERILIELKSRRHTTPVDSDGPDDHEDVEEEIVPDEEVLDGEVLADEEALLEEDAPEEDAPEEDAPEEDAPEEDAPEEDAPEEDAPEEDAPEEDAPEASELSTSEPESDLETVYEVDAVEDTWCSYTRAICCGRKHN